jgi:hypothetical protein
MRPKPDTAGVRVYHTHIQQEFFPGDRCRVRGVFSRQMGTTRLSYVLPSQQKEEAETAAGPSINPGPWQDCFLLHQTNGPSGKSKLRTRNSLMESRAAGTIKMK